MSITLPFHVKACVSFAGSIIYTNFMIEDTRPINCNESLQEALARPWIGRAIMHLDLDAFFAAVAQKDNPELKGKPVIVGGRAQSRGVVSTASYEARAFGVHSAMSAFEAQRLCPDGIWVTPDFARYKELSAQVFDIIYQHTPYIERTSIDEAYADITPDAAGTKHPVAIALAIQEEIAKLDLSCSIGLSNNRTASKIGSDFLKPRGLTLIWPGNEASFLAPLPIEKMGGIGRVTASKLRTLHINTLGELAAMNPKDLEQLIGSAAFSLVQRAAGRDDTPLSVEHETKSISNESTFASDLTSPTDIERELKRLTQKVCWRLRKEDLYGKTINLKLKFSDFTVKTFAQTLACATNTDSIVEQTVLELYRSSQYQGYAVRLLGVSVSNFADPCEQLNLFKDADQTDAGREKGLLDRIDAIREKFGYGAIKRGSQISSPDSNKE